MPISPRPPSGDGRPWSSTAIPPAYRRNRIAKGERSIPLLTTRGYPLVLGDKVPKRPLSCTPRQQSTPVLPPPRPASSASVPMKATINENTFSELVTYWEKTTLEKAKTSFFSSEKPAIKGTSLPETPYNLTKPGESKNYEDEYDTYSEPDHPHECDSLPPPVIDLQFPVDTPDQFPEADNFHRPENGGASNLEINLQTKKLQILTNEVDVPDIMSEADSHLPENLGITDIEVILAAMRANTKLPLPERDSPRTDLAENISITDRSVTAPTKLMAADIDNIQKADSPYKEENLPLQDQDATAVAKLQADDIKRPEKNPKVDSPHKDENPPLPEQAVIAKPLAADIEIPESYQKAKSPQKPDNVPLIVKDVIMRKTTFDAFPEAKVPHPLHVNVDAIQRGQSLTTAKTTADLGTVDSFPEADVPHPPGSFNPPHVNVDAIQRGKPLSTAKTTADLETVDSFPEADVPHPVNCFPEADVPHPPGHFNPPHVNVDAIQRGKPLSTAKTTADLGTVDSFTEADVPHQPGHFTPPLVNVDAIKRGKPLSTAKTTADLGTVDSFPEADVPHQPGNFTPPLVNVDAIQRGKPLSTAKTTADLGTVDSFSEADVPHPPGAFNPPDVHVDAIQKGKPLSTPNEDTLTETDVPNISEHFPCPNVDLMKKNFLNVRVNADHVANKPNEAQMQTSDMNEYLNDLIISGKAFPLPENIEIDCRRARTLDQHLATVKQKVLASTAHADVERLNELQKRMHNIHTILKEISEKAKFANKEMVDIESASLLVVSKIETRKYIDNKEIEPSSIFQTQTKLPPVPTRGKPSTATMVAKKHLSDQTNMPSDHIVKPRQTKTKPLPAIFQREGRLHPASKPAKTQIYEQTATGSPLRKADRCTPPERVKAYEIRQLAGSHSSSSEIIETRQPIQRLDDKLRPSISRGPVVSSTHNFSQCRQGTDISNEYKQLQRAMDRVGRNPSSPTLQAHISHREPEPGRPKRRPRNEKQGYMPCVKRFNEGKSQSEASIKDKPNQRKPKKKQQKKKKVEKAPIKIEERPPFLSDIKPSKYFSDVSRLEDTP